MFGDINFTMRPNLLAIVTEFLDLVSSPSTSSEYVKLIVTSIATPASSIITTSFADVEISKKVGGKKRAKKAATTSIVGDGPPAVSLCRAIIDATLHVEQLFTPSEHKNTLIAQLQKTLEEPQLTHFGDLGRLLQVFLFFPDAIDEEEKICKETHAILEFWMNSASTGLSTSSALTALPKRAQNGNFARTSSHGPSKSIGGALNDVGAGVIAPTHLFSRLPAHILVKSGAINKLISTSYKHIDFLAAQNLEKDNDADVTSPKTLLPFVDGLDEKNIRNVKAALFALGNFVGSANSIHKKFARVKNNDQDLFKNAVEAICALVDGDKFVSAKHQFLSVKGCAIWAANIAAQSSVGAEELERHGWAINNDNCRTKKRTINNRMTAAQTSTFHSPESSQVPQLPSKSIKRRPAFVFSARSHFQMNKRIRQSSSPQIFSHTKGREKSPRKYDLTYFEKSRCKNYERSKSVTDFHSSTQRQKRLKSFSMLTDNRPKQMMKGIVGSPRTPLLDIQPFDIERFQLLADQLRLSRIVQVNRNSEDKQNTIENTSLVMKKELIKTDPSLVKVNFLDDTVNTPSPLELRLLRAKTYNGKLIKAGGTGSFVSSASSNSLLTLSRTSRASTVVAAAVNVDSEVDNDTLEGNYDQKNIARLQRTEINQRLKGGPAIEMKPEAFYVGADLSPTKIDADSNRIQATDALSNDLNQWSLSTEPIPNFGGRRCGTTRSGGATLHLDWNGTHQLPQAPYFQPPFGLISDHENLALRKYRRFLEKAGEIHDFNGFFDTVDEESSAGENCYYNSSIENDSANCLSMRETDAAPTPSITAGLSILFKRHKKPANNEMHERIRTELCTKHSEGVIAIPTDVLQIFPEIFPTEKRNRFHKAQLGMTTKTMSKFHDKGNCLFCSSSIYKSQQLQTPFEGEQSEHTIASISAEVRELVEQLGTRSERESPSIVERLITLRVNHPNIFASRCLYSDALCLSPRLDLAPRRLLEQLFWPTFKIENV